MLETMVRPLRVTMVTASSRTQKARIDQLPSGVAQIISLIGGTLCLLLDSATAAFCQCSPMEVYNNAQLDGCLSSDWGIWDKVSPHKVAIF